MRLREFLVMGVIALLSLAGCAAKIPFKGENSKERIAADLSIPAASIIHQDRCTVGRYDGTAKAAVFECIYIATAEYAALLDFDTEKLRFRESLRIDKSAESVAYVTRSVITGTLAQIQVRHRGAYYLLEFINGDLGQLGNHDTLKVAYEHLRSLGIADAAAPLPYVTRQLPPTPIVIPIYIPR